MKSYTHTHIIWDFNGTILDDVQLGIDCVNRMLAPRGLPVIPSVAHYRSIFGFPIDAYYRRLGFDFEKEDYDTVLAPEWVAHYLAGEGNCHMNAGVAETLAAIATRGIPQLVLSATRLEQLQAQLDRLDIAPYFDEVLGLDNIHARSKRLLATEWRARNPDGNPLFVGDTAHDADVARAIGADCVLFTGGHQSVETLAACGYPLIERMEDLLKYV